MKRGEIYTRKVSTVWYFWACPRPKCSVVLKSPVEGFVLQAAQQHSGKHDRDVERAKNLATVKAQLAWTKKKN